MSVGGVEVSRSTAAGPVVPERIGLHTSGMDVVNLFEDYEGAARLVVAEQHRPFIENGQFIQPTGEVFDSTVSAHGVQFGRIIGTRWGEGGRTKTTSGVAIKPTGGLHEALHEAAGYQKLEALGVPTYCPVAIVTTRDGSFVITRRRNGLISLDQDRWVRGMEPVDEKGVEDLERNLATVRDISQTMAWVHVNGLFLPDGQVKNWAVTPEREVGAIDPEKHEQLALGHNDAPERMWADIIKLYKSLRLSHADPEGIYGVGLFHNVSPGMLEQLFVTYTLNPYIEALLTFMNYPELGDASRSDAYWRQAESLIDGLSGYEDRLKEVVCL